MNYALMLHTPDDVVTACEKRLCRCHRIDHGILLTAISAATAVMFLCACLFVHERYSHPHNMIRDTATYRPFKAANRTGKLQPRYTRTLNLILL
jgi:hypothetical protein